MKIQENVNMAQYTTFKVGGPARYFCAVKNESDVVEAVKFVKEKGLPFIVVGGGSNLIFPDSGYRGLVMRMEMKGVEYKSQIPNSKSQKITNTKSEITNSGLKTDDGDTVYITAAAGEDWETLVKSTVDRGLYGLEGLSSIPGTVGASPVQNVGAYGVDVSGAIERVRVFDTEKMEFTELSREDCKFSYRDSMFKHDKGHYIVTKVIFKLSKNGDPTIGYKDVKEYFAKKGISKPTLNEVRCAVIEIRKNKLPDWTHWGTAGSYFKNPIVAKEKFEELKSKFPGLPGFDESDGRVKVSLGWILDKVCDAKGLTVGNVGTYEKQALVVVAKPGATATQVLDFSNELIRRVREKTGIEIEGEVEWAVA